MSQTMEIVETRTFDQMMVKLVQCNGHGLGFQLQYLAMLSTWTRQGDPFKVMVKYAL